MGQPTEPPESGEVIQPPPAPLDQTSIRIKVYEHPKPFLWIYLAGRWRHATVWARYDRPNGNVHYAVECSSPDELSRLHITVLWGPDSVRPG